jgi:radical SAM superfamily enzyme YgiQ (UPF0313 family)
MKRIGQRIALLAWYPEPDPALPPFIPNLGIYMIAAALRKHNSYCEVTIWDECHRSPEIVAEEIERFDPDILAMSAFVWSLGNISRVLRVIAHADPTRWIVMGGASARPNMLDHHPFRDLPDKIDVLVEGEGELTFSEIVKATQTYNATLEDIAGLTLRQQGKWQNTKPRPAAQLNALASPYEYNLVPRKGISILETYRGCPLSCTFCEWGVMEAPKNVLSKDRLIEEFSHLDRIGYKALLLADAGLNLNNSAFKSLRDANIETGFFKDKSLIAEIYPKSLSEDHLSFLETVGAPHIGIGLQSFDEAVLSHIERKFDPSRLGDLLSVLRSVASITTEIIMGLPGDSPDRFLKNYNRARSLGVGLRVYHCAVLPSALMRRSPSSDELRYDPVTLKMQSCRGWPPGSIDVVVNKLNDDALCSGGASGNYFWIFPPN